MAIPAAARRWLDPMTGDYVVENGGPRADTTRASKVLLRLRMRRGSCPLLPRLGSRLYKITKATSNAQRRAQTYVFEALDDLIKSGEIRDVEVEVDIVRTGGTTALAITVSFTDTDSDTRTVTYEHRLGA